MTEQERDRKIREARKWIRWEEEGYESDQMLRRVQPPLFKERMSDRVIRLPQEFDRLELQTDYRKILNGRKSSRVYTEGPITLLQLSFLLWSAAGVKGIRGKQYATLRTVPSGGARHPFEIYVLVLRTEGLEPGLYHYQPKDHTLELLRSADLTDEFMKTVGDSVCGQKWVLKASAVFYYSLIPYRGEWRYAFEAHRVMMMDAGHSMENIYMTCSAMDLGTCAIGAVDSDVTDRLFGLDGEEEYALCCIPVGTIRASDAEEEKSFYAFLNTEEEYYHR